jgi:predicted amidophosphoribosyltransferase
MELSGYMRKLLSAFVSPQSCLVCGKNSGSGVPLCETCLETAFLHEARALGSPSVLSERCVKCGRPLISAKELCYTCRNTGLLASVDRIVPLFPYTVTAQELLVAWKMHGIRGLSPVFARIIAECRSAIPALQDLPVVPVPPRPGKRAEKGWDQIEELSRFLALRHRVPVLKCLERTSGVQQKKLGRIARFSNIHGAIVPVPGISVPAAAIVLDDLITTGSTIDACADALKCAGCEKVYALTLFYD